MTNLFEFNTIISILADNRDNIVKFVFGSFGTWMCFVVIMFPIKHGKLDDMRANIESLTKNKTATVSYIIAGGVLGMTLGKDLIGSFYIGFVTMTILSSWLERTLEEPGEFPAHLESKTKDGKQI